MRTRYYTIPVFIPGLACPFRCIFCNQHKISGYDHIPATEEVRQTVEKYLSTIPGRKRHVEIGFFGGTFTGLPLEEQERYLEVAQPYFENGDVHGLRLSTRPDYINAAVLKMLKRYHVGTIELGAQSMDDEVLKLSGRGHTAKDTADSSAMIKKSNFSLGLQMMIGLPGDTIEKSLDTARQIVELGADNTRIYPTVVIKDTPLEDLYRKGKYLPLSLEEAVRWTAGIMKIFEAANVAVIRVGLHPSEGLLKGTDLVAGPFHESFRELVMTELWWENLEYLIGHGQAGDKITVTVAPAQLNFAVGYEARNKKKLLKHYRIVSFQTDDSLEGRNYEADHH
jgi:histone acetyltransferase (RNA polymerase elongator complex component)